MVHVGALQKRRMRASQVFFVLCGKGMFIGGGFNERGGTSSVVSLCTFPPVIVLVPIMLIMHVLTG